MGLWRWDDDVVIWDQVFVKHLLPLCKNSEQNQTVAFQPKTPRKYFPNKNARLYAFSISLYAFYEVYLENYQFCTYSEKFVDHSEPKLLLVKQKPEKNKDGKREKMKHCNGWWIGGVSSGDGYDIHVGYAELDGDGGGGDGGGVGGNGGGNGGGGVDGNLGKSLVAACGWAALPLSTKAMS